LASRLFPTPERKLRHDINKKLQTLSMLELPLLADRGFSVTAGCNNVTAYCNAPEAKPQQSEGSVNREIVEIQALDGIRTHDLRFTKPSFTLNNVDLDLF
jgi:hypothetical protein